MDLKTFKKAKKQNKTPNVQWKKTEKLSESLEN